jgi:Asp-tRNA(Asn)/Glu-tRNA(Gln) amidotransferase C subunit
MLLGVYLRRRLASAAAMRSHEPNSTFAQLSSDEVERLATLSVLNLNRSTPGFESMKRDLEGVLGLLQQVQASAPPPSATAVPPSSEEAALRVASLRAGGTVSVIASDALLNHAPVTDGAYFKAGR